MFLFRVCTALLFFVAGTALAAPGCPFPALLKYFPEGPRPSWRLADVSETLTPAESSLVNQFRKRGGEGKIVERILTDGDGEETRTRYLQVARFPDGYFGRGGAKLLAELQARGIPLLVDPTSTGIPFLTQWIGAMTWRTSEKIPAPQIQTTVVFPRFPGLPFSPTTGNYLVLRHELQHVRDFVTDAEPFLNSLPQLPTRYTKIVEKLARGEELNEAEENLVELALKFSNVHAEVRASEAALTSLFSRDGLAALGQRPFTITLFAFNEVLNTAFRNAQVVYYGARLGRPNAVIALALAKTLAMYCAYTNGLASGVRALANRHRPEPLPEETSGRPKSPPYVVLKIATCGAMP